MFRKPTKTHPVGTSPSIKTPTPRKHLPVGITMPKMNLTPQQAIRYSTQCPNIMAAFDLITGMEAEVYQETFSMVREIHDMQSLEAIERLYENLWEAERSGKHALVGVSNICK